MTQLSTSLKSIQGESELQQTLQQILPDRVKRLTVGEDELLQMEIQLDEVQKENMIIKCTNTQITDNFEDVKTLEVKLEELKNINEFNDDILQHKEVDIEELAQKCEGLTQLNSQLMTRLEIMNRELNELKITSEEFDTKSVSEADRVK